MAPGGSRAMAKPRSSRLMALSLVVFALWQCRPSVPGLALVEVEEEQASNFVTKVVGAAAQGATAAFVAAILSAITEPIVNRLLVKRQTFAVAISEISMKMIVQFFFTTFPTNMLKFPAFEVINMMLSFTSLSGPVRGVVNGFCFCSLMLPVTNYRFRKSMGWEINPALLYQAYIPTVARDIVYGWARGFVGVYLVGHIHPASDFQKAFIFGVTVWAACIISSPGNEWRGYTLQPKDKKLSFAEYFKPVNYARSTGVGATIMGIALMAGNLVTPYAEQFFGYVKSTIGVLPVVALVVVGGVLALRK